MSSWKDFLMRAEDGAGRSNGDSPGPVMVRFANRYLEPLDSIKYKIECDGQIVTGETTEQNSCVELAPQSFSRIKVLVWSRKNSRFKQIDEFEPLCGQPLLVTQRLGTFKHISSTEPHPTEDAFDSPHPTQAEAAGVAGQMSCSQGVSFARKKNDKAEPEHTASRDCTPVILVEQLKKIFPAASEAYLAQIAAELNVDLAKYKLDTRARRAHFFSQVRQEAGPALSPKEESLDYPVDALIGKFSYYARHHDEAKTDGRVEVFVESDKRGNRNVRRARQKQIVQAASQETIANKAYAGRGGNGDEKSGDGWRYRGRGIFQLTLRENYRSFTRDYSTIWSDGAPDFVNNPDLVSTFPYFIRSAVWYWLKRGLPALADQGETDEVIDAVTKRINGPGMDAAARRRHNFHELSNPAFK